MGRFDPKTGAIRLHQDKELGDGDLLIFAAIQTMTIDIALTLPTFGFFEFTPMGAVVLATGIIYMVIIGRHLLPVREGARGKEDINRLRGYVTEVRVAADSPLNGKTLLDSRLGKEYDFTVLAIQRANGDQPALSR